MNKHINFKELHNVIDPLMKKDGTMDGKFIAVFKGSLDSEGVNWCSDCVKAGPVLDEFLLPRCEAEQIPLYYIDCGLRDEWRDPQNDARQHKTFNVSGVPCVALVEDGALVIKLQEDALFDGRIVGTL